MNGFRKHPATYDDLVALPRHLVGELVGGALFASPRPSTGAATVIAALSACLWGPFRDGASGPGGWWLLREPELHFGGDVLVPDLAGWRRERLPKMPDAPSLALAADWVCEVLSDSTAALDRIRKLPLYLCGGIGHVWLIDPPHQTLEVYRNAGSHWVAAGVFGSDQVARIEPFEAVELSLGELWLDE